MEANLAKQKALLKQYISNHEVDKAVTVLCRMAVRCAQQGNFDQADSYRDLLYEVDNSALVAIMKVNEFIELEKRRFRNTNFKHSWPDFFKKLSAEEAKAFFYALQTVEFQDDFTILKQGKPNERLYLVDSGQLKVIFKSRGQEVLIHQLARGNIFGEDTFFSVNVCTASVISLSTVHLKYLDQHHLRRLEENFPVIADSLAHICSGGRRIYDYLKAKELDRRTAKRIHLKRKIAVQLLTAESRHPMQRTLQADLWDVSKHGLCFHMESKNREFVRRLIGRSMGVRIKLEVDGRPKVAAVTGMVQGVQNQGRKNFSIHMKLNPPFSHAAMATIERIAAMRK